MGTPAGWKPGDKFVTIDIETKAKRLDLPNSDGSKTVDQKSISQSSGSMGFRFW